MIKALRKKRVQKGLKLKKEEGHKREKRKKEIREETSKK